MLSLWINPETGSKCRSFKCSESGSWSSTTSASERLKMSYRSYVRIHHFSRSFTLPFTSKLSLIYYSFFGLSWAFSEWWTCADSGLSGRHLVKWQFGSKIGAARCIPAAFLGRFIFIRIREGAWWEYFSFPQELLWFAQLTSCGDLCDVLSSSPCSCNRQTVYALLERIDQPGVPSVGKTH